MSYRRNAGKGMSAVGKNGRKAEKINPAKGTPDVINIAIKIVFLLPSAMIAHHSWAEGSWEIFELGNGKLRIVCSIFFNIKAKTITDLTSLIKERPRIDDLLAS